MFQFPELALLRVVPYYRHWVSPFGNPRIIACLPAPRGLSQAPTSFIASCCQGIHHVPLVAFSPKRSVGSRCSGELLETGLTSTTTHLHDVKERDQSVAESQKEDSDGTCVPGCLEAEAS